jgi:hypothetical protein
MDITLLATAAVSAVAPYLAKGGEEMAKGMGKDLWELIKKPFTSEKEQKLVGQLEENPGDAKLQGKVEGKLEELLEENPDITAQLQDLLEKMQAGGQIKQSTMNITGDNNIAMQDTNNSSISITRS